MAKKTAQTEVVETVETNPTFGVTELVEHVAEETGKQLKPVNLRNLLRRLESDGTISREGEKRSRWTFSGADDENVVAVVAAVKAGADGSNKKAKAEVEASDEDDSPAEEAPKPKRKARAKKAAPAPEPELEEEDDLEVDLEDLD